MHTIQCAFLKSAQAVRYPKKQETRQETYSTAYKRVWHAKWNNIAVTQYVKMSAVRKANCLEEWWLEF